MLVLARKIGETIRIGDDITVRVVDVQRGQVRLAIDAPREIAVHREEIWSVVREQNVRSAALGETADAAELWRRSRSGDSEDGP